MSRLHLLKTLAPAACLAVLAATPAAWADDAKPAKDDDRIVEKNEVKQRTVVHATADPDAFWVSDSGPMRFKFDEAMGRGFLGVTLLELTPELREHFGVPEQTGVMVSRVEADSPAAKAGIKAGDILTGIDGEDVEGSWDVTKLVRAKKDGDGVAIELYRDGKVQKLSATVAERDRRMIDVRGLPMKRMQALGPEEKAAMDAAMRAMRDRVAQIVADPGMKDKVMVLRSEREAELEKRLAQLEKRLAELQRQIDNKNR